MAYTSVPRYDVHKFREIKPELDRDNWGTWKRKMVATIKERNLYEILDGTDAPPVLPPVRLHSINSRTNGSSETTPPIINCCYVYLWNSKPKSRIRKEHPKPGKS